MDWLQNSHADYVLASYGIALATLAGFALLTWLKFNKKQHEWKRFQQEHNEHNS